MIAHSRATEILSTWNPSTSEQRALRDEYLAHLEENADGLLKPCFPAHLTAGVLITSIDRHQVLLNLHGKAKRWFAFGGHIETEDVDLVASAWREGTEESGIADLIVEPKPVHLSKHVVEFCDPRGPVTHLDVRFVARVEPQTAFAISDESDHIAWFDIDDLPTDEPDMIELISLACQPR
ncbi:MAG TPA: NUDIX domain-containing protein [Marmoricola sp.]|nr:NUDIX domain-containing protein [Marmoricola sp.]